MKTFSKLSIALVILFSFSSCKTNQNDFDASGSFEAEETIISSEAAGIIKQLNIEEGQDLETGQVVGFIDTTQLALKKKQLDAQIAALLSRKPNISVQLAALEEQLSTAEMEKNRITNLVKAEAATTKQLDDINASVEVIKRQINAQKSSLDIATGGINKDANSLFIQQEQLRDQLQKSYIINPVKGTVLSKYAEQFEMSAPGKPIYKIADLSEITLRAYISGDQLSRVKLNQKVKVKTDDGNGGFKTSEGTITWINDKAEFTPKTIQTKSERANMVYAVKIRVKNNGDYKIGMYGEISFQ